MREGETRRKKAGPETARTRTVSPGTTVLRESVHDGTVHNFHLSSDTQTRSSSRLLQEILNILLPSSVAVKVGRSSHSPSLEETGGVPLLQSDRETCLPSVEQADFPPMTGRGKHRVHLGNSINRPSKPLHGFHPPTPEGFNGEWDQPTPREKPSRISAVLLVRGSGSGRSIRVGSGVEPSAALRMRYHDVSVDEWV